MSPDMMSNAVYGERETIKCIGDINKNPKQWCKYVFSCHPRGCLQNALATIFSAIVYVVSLNVKTSMVMMSSG